ncbi:hypothetical protein CHUAL_007743 [Chamberlinius hualienensis]
MFALKFVILAIGVAAVFGRPSGPQYYGGQAAAVYASAPRYNAGYAAAALQEDEGPYEERNYKVSYSVKDDPSYNFQSRNEEKNGKTVTGEYTVLEPTGDLRVVKYIADENGFRADVQNQAGYAQPFPVVQKQPTYANLVAKHY